MRALGRRSESDHASVSNNTIPRGKHNPAFHAGPSEGNTPRVAGCPPAPPASLGRTGGAGLSLTDELCELGDVPAPSALIARTWLAVLAELNAAHPADVDSPGLLGGITGHPSLCSPKGSPPEGGEPRGSGVNLLAYIPVGPDRTITAAHLSALTELEDRAVRQEIERLVVDEKKPIGSGPKGYFLAQQPADLKHTIENLESRAAAMYARCKALRIAQERLDDYRPTLFDVEGLR